MDFADTPEEAAFRAEAVEWLVANAPLRAPTAGTDITAILDPEFDQAEGIERAQEWQARAADDGWAAVAWPREYGGRGVGPRARRSCSTRSGRSSTSPTISSASASCSPARP